MTVKAVPHEIALPNEAGIYLAARPLLPTSTIDVVTGLQAALDGKQAASAALSRIYSGTGSPEGVVTAGIGSIYLRTNGGAGTSLYVKESGASNTGWQPK